MEFLHPLLNCVLIELQKPYYANVCRICSKHANKWCAACKTFGYCSKEHQVLDWDRHKNVCKALRRLNITYEVGCSFEQLKLTYERYKQQLLSPSFSLNDCDIELLKQVLLCPKICAICYSKDNLFECPNCLVVWYCSSKHQMQDSGTHEVYCNSLKLKRSLDIFHGEFEAVDLANNIDGRVKCLPKDTRDLFRLIKSQNSIFGLETYDEFVSSTIQANPLSVGATILYVLERLGLIRLRNFIKNRLVIHIIVTRDDLLNDLYQNCLEFILLRWIKNVNDIEILVFSNEFFGSSSTRFITRDLRSATITFLPGFYLPIFKENPDIVVVFNYSSKKFNNGFMPLLLNKNIPLVVTSCTESQLQNDIQFLKSTLGQVEVTISPQKNPFAELIPTQISMLYDGTEKVYFNSEYLMVLKRTV